jgi:carbon monoxide dehydrogenase subunit G
MVELTGTYRIPAPRDGVYAALRDPAVLQSCIEGCEQLTETSPGNFEAQLRLGLGAIRGRFTGRARITGEQPPESFTLGVEGKGPGGHVRGEGHLTLSESDHATEISCRATAEAGGALAAVGSRLIQAAAARMMEKFFSTLASDLKNRPTSGPQS